MRQAKAAGGVQRHGADQGWEVDCTGVIDTHRGGQEGFKGNRTGGGLLERQALGFLVSRGVHRRDHVDQAGGYGIDHRQPVIFRPQRRGELEKGAVVADVEFVQREVVDRGASRDVQARFLGAGEGG